MEDGQYAAISGYLEHRTYPAVFTKSQKFSYITKKLQKLQTVIRQAVLQGTDSQDGTERDQLTCCKEK